MIDPSKLVAFALVTATTSIVPGPQMIFVMTQAAWRGGRAGIAAMAGLQIGNAHWFLLAGLGIGTLAHEAPLAFTALTLAGACYLAWLGIAALRHAGEGHDTAEDPGLPKGAPRKLSTHAFRDGILVAATNPKSLIYVFALLPPFIDTTRPIAPQMIALAAIAVAIDVTICAVYIAAGSGLARAIARPQVSRWLDRAIGLVFLALATGVVVSVIVRGG